MKKPSIVLAVILATALVAAFVAPASARWGHGMRGDGPGRGMALRPQFTTEQEQAIQKVRDKHENERVALHNRLGVAVGELQELLAADEPDLGKLEAKIEETAGLRLDMMKLRLRQHGEIRGLLDPDQRTLFDRGLGRMLGGAVGGRMCDMNGGAGPGMPGMGSGMAPGQACPMGAGPGMPAAGPGGGGPGMQGMGPGMMPGSAQSGPACPMQPGACPMMSMRCCRSL
jgi:Spy/CpxP family protein refolding chaperone